MKKILVSLVLVFSFIFNSYANILTSVWDIWQKFSGELVRKAIDIKYPSLKNKNCDDYWKSWDWVTVWCGKSYHLNKADLDKSKESPIQEKAWVKELNDLTGKKLSEEEYYELNTIDFRNKNLAKIPEWVFKMKNLENLILFKNKIEKIPDSIWNLKKLKKLIFSFNEIETIPNTIGKLKNLQLLNLRDNKIEKIPEWIFKLKGLEILTLNNNVIKKIPIDILKLKNLIFLNLSSNKKIWEINTIFSTDIYKIKKCQNNITTSWKKLCIDSTWNKIKITIEGDNNPDWVKELNKLTWKNLSEEEYYKLNTIDLSDKGLLEIPIGLLNLKNLDSINLSWENYLKNLNTLFNNYGPLSDFRYRKIICQNHILKRSVSDIVSKKYNSWKRVCIDSGKMDEKIKIYVEKNKNINWWEEELNDLTWYHFDKNKYYNLEFFALIDNTNINKIPEWVFKIKKLTRLFLENLDIKNLSEEIWNLVNLETLILYKTNISKLPDSLVNLRKIENLDLIWDKLWELNFHFKTKRALGFWEGSEEFQVKKCQNNITTSWKKMCIDSTWEKIRIYIEEKNNNTKTLKLTESFKKKLDKKIDWLLVKLDNKYSTISEKINRLEKLISKIKVVINTYPKYKNILEYINQKFEEEIVLFRTGLY